MVRLEKRDNVTELFSRSRIIKATQENDGADYVQIKYNNDDTTELIDLVYLKLSDFESALNTI